MAWKMAASFVLALALILSPVNAATTPGLQREYTRSAFPFINDFAHILYRVRSSSDWLEPALEQLALVTNTSTAASEFDGDQSRFGENALVDGNEEALAPLRPLLRNLKWRDVKRWIRRIAKHHLYRDVSKPCVDDLNLIITRLDNETDVFSNSADELWASRFVDAMGKPQHNVLDGNTFWYGSHEECQSIERDLDTFNRDSPVVYEDGQFRQTAIRPPYFGGRYCLADVGTPVHVTQQMLLHGRPPGIHWGFCVPERCSTDDFKLLWRNVLQKLSVDAAQVGQAAERFDRIFDIDKDGYDDDDEQPVRNKRQRLRKYDDVKPVLAVNWAKCDTVGVERGADATAIWVLCMLGFFALLALLGTGLEIYLLSSHSARVTDRFFVKPYDGTAAIPSAPTLTRPGDCNGTAAELSTPPPGATSADGVSRRRTLADFSLPLWMRILTTFSVIHNGRKVLETFAPATTKSGRVGATLATAPADEAGTSTTIATVHGIRFLSMVWVILGHTYAHMGTMLSNPRVLPDVAKQFWFQIVMNASLSVDTFLLLSGLLVTYLFVSEWNKRGRRTPTWSAWVHFYVHRYLRLTPVYMLILGLTAGLLPLLMSGPSSYMSDAWMPNRCAGSWWTNALYLNNILMFEDQCMSWTWYLAIDMQLYVITPIVLYPLVKYGTRVAVGILGVLMVAHMITTALITALNDMPAHFATKQTLLEPFTLHKYFDLYYVKTWCRAGPYFIGMLLGIILFNRQQRARVADGASEQQAALDTPNKNKLMSIIAGWLIAAVCLIVPLYALWPTYLREEDFPLTVSTLYNTVARSAWALGVAWVLYMCETGRGGPINKLLAWRALVPLSRLTYCAYLIHMPIILAVLGNTTQQMPFSHLTCLVYFAGFLLMTYLAAFVLCITLEAPWLGLEKIFRTSNIGKVIDVPKRASVGGGRAAAAGTSRVGGGGGGGGGVVRDETPSPTLADNDRDQLITKARA